MLNRRAFLKSSGLVLFSAGLSSTPLFLARAAQAAVVPQSAYQRQKIIVTIFQRGGMDGLGAVSPYTDKVLPTLRPKLMLPTPGSGKENALLELDGRFGLHPALSFFHEFYKEGRLAIVHGVGNTYSTRSHLDAAQYWESGTPGDKSTNSGWLNRALHQTSREKDSPLRAVSITAEQPRSFHGNYPSITLADIHKFVGQDINMAYKENMAMLYNQSQKELLQTTAKDSFEIMQMLSSENLASYQTAKGVDYPQAFKLTNGQTQPSLGDSLKQIAQLIKANVGLQVAFTEMPNFIWDTHVNEHAVNGPFFTAGNDFSRSISAFWKDLGPFADDVVLMTMTEFGRTVAQNDTNGTDHGRGTCMFVLGNNVKGGKVYGNIPDRLELDALEDKQDLPVSTDYRSVADTIIRRQLNVQDTKAIFSGWQGNGLSILS